MCFTLSQLLAFFGSHHDFLQLVLHSPLLRHFLFTHLCG